MNIAIVGATGIVGQSLVQIVADKLPKAKLTLYANNGAGSKIVTRGKTHVVKHVEQIFENIPQYALFVATKEVSKNFVPQLLKLGVTCIDNSSYFRMCKKVPLVVPCINGDTIGNHRLIANPNCTTIQVVMAVNALKPLLPTKMTVATYQAVSGAGREGMVDLQNKNSYGKLKTFAHPIFDNVIPKIDVMTKSGYTAEEVKLIKESQKILQIPLEVNSFCARVPVTTGHCAFVNLQFKQKFTLPQVAELLKNHPNVLLFDDAEREIYPLPSMLRHTKYVGVGRLTKDATSNGINMFVVADNLLRGASYNAYEILEYLLQRDGQC